MPDHPPYFPFYHADFTSDDKVEAMTTEAVGAYVLLLCKAWTQDPAGTVPDNDAVLSRWARMSPEQWSRVRQSVLSAFTRRNGRWVQRRMVAEHRKVAGRAAQAREAAVRRWDKDRRRRKDGAGKGTEKPKDVPRGTGGKPGRKRDLVWDAFVARFYPSGVAEGQRKSVGALVRDLKQLGVTDENCDQIDLRADRLARTWGDAKLTARSLVKHWDRFASEPDPGGGGSESERRMAQRQAYDRAALAKLGPIPRE